MLLGHCTAGRYCCCWRVLMVMTAWLLVIGWNPKGCILNLDGCEAFLLPTLAAAPRPPVILLTTSSSTTTTPLFSFQNNNNSNQVVVKDNDESNNDHDDEIVVDVAIVGSGIAGLCAGAILNTLHQKKVGVFESHYLPGGCAHAFPTAASSSSNNNKKNNNVKFLMDSGPTIVLGCSGSEGPYNPLQQVLRAVGVEERVEWIRYDGWGVIENPGGGRGRRDDDKNEEFKQWRFTLGPNVFEEGPLTDFGGGPQALQEFAELRQKTRGLVVNDIPAMAMRPGPSALIPLLRYFSSLVRLLWLGPHLTRGTFDAFLNGPVHYVRDEWLRAWLDALAFSLSGLPAARTSAAAMAAVLYEMHDRKTNNVTLDYPRGGLGTVIDALVAGVEQGNRGSKVYLKSHVESIDFGPDNDNSDHEERTASTLRCTGVTLRGGKTVRAREGVICNAPIWTLSQLVQDERARQVLNGNHPYYDDKEEKNKPRQSWFRPPSKQQHQHPRYVLSTDRPTVTATSDESLLSKTDTAEMTGSFLHLHLAIRADGLNLDEMEAHYTVMDRSLLGNNNDRNDAVEKEDGPCGELNMIAVSNPCVIDKTLAPDGYMVLHAYAAGNEPYDVWKGLKRNSGEYKRLKEERAQVLWRAVESIIPDVRHRTVVELIGSPQTHERFLRRPNGTYGTATEDYLPDGSTPIPSLVLAGDGIFPGIGIPAVALNGASAANAFVSPLEQWRCLDRLKEQGKL